MQKQDKNVVPISSEIGGHQDLCCNSPTSPSATNKRDSDYGDHVWLDATQIDRQIIVLAWLSSTVTSRESMLSTDGPVIMPAQRLHFCASPS